MSNEPEATRLWAVALWVAVLTGIVVAWSPRYWAVSVAITGIAIVAMSWVFFSFFRGWNLQLAWQTVPVALIGAWGFLQIAFGKTLIPSLTLGNSLVWAVSACAFLAGSQILRDRNARQLFLKLLLWSITALAVVAMVQFHNKPLLVFGIFPAADGVTGTFISANQFAALMELGAPLALWYMLDRNPLPGGLCYAMILAGAITSGSRAGTTLVCTEAAVFLLGVLSMRRLGKKTAMVIFAGLALLVAVAAVIAGTDQIRDHFEDKNPYAIRKQLFDSTRQLIAERPWIGYGMGTWRAAYPHAATFDLALVANEAHNDWVQWASEGGIPFLILMAGLVIWIARPALQSIWGIGVLSVMAHSYVDYLIREPALSFLWFTLAGVVSGFDRRAAQRSRSKGARTE